MMSKGSYGQAFVEFSQLKGELKGVRNQANDIMVNAKKYMQSFQSPYMDLV